MFFYFIMEQLEQKIREALPRFKELTKGCLIQDNLSGWIYEVIDNKYCLQLYSCDYNIFRTFELEDLKNFEIITHDIKLNDVLEWLCLNKNYSCNMQDGKFYIFGIPWNLSSVYLKDQSEELKQFLNEL